jgi:hypothetical protein
MCIGIFSRCQGRRSEVTDHDTSTRVTTLDPLVDKAWLDLVTTTASSVFHSPAWLEVLARTYGFEPRAAVLIDDAGRATAGIPYCVIGGLPERRVATPPFSDYADPLVKDRRDWDALVAVLLAEGCPINVRCLHNDVPLADERFPVVNRARWHRLTLDDDIESLWGGLHASARRAVRKADNDGLTVREVRGREGLRAFFDLHFRTRKRKYRLLAQPYAFFQNIWELFVEDGRGSILGAYVGERGTTSSVRPIKSSWPCGRTI